MDNIKNNFLDFMQKNYAWIIAVLTVVGVVGSYLFKFIEFLKAASYFSYYGLDINLYKYNDVGFFYDLSLSILFILALVSLLYCIYQTVSNIKEGKWSKVFNKNNLSVVLLSNSYIALLLNIHITEKLTEKSFWLSFLVLIIFEVLFSLMLFGKTKKKVELNEGDNLLNLLKCLPFAIIILIFLYVCYVNYDLNNRENYRVINENKVIVYSNNDYSLTLDCEIINDELTIYKGTQEKINNENVYSKYIEFNNIIVK